MIHYILQIIGFQLLFLIAYDLFLKRETFFNLNRLYLLLSPIIAILLPFIRLEFIKNGIPETLYVPLPEVILSQNTSVEPTSPLSLLQILKWIWLIGMGISLVIFIAKLLKINRLKRIGISTTEDDLNIILIPDSNHAFTFFNRIYLGKNIPESMRNSILEHEKIHIQQKHGWDLIFYEILCIVLWFNPLIYIFRNRLSAVHEYTADEKVSLTLGKPVYFQKLLAAVFQTETVSFVNSFFNQSLIKTRISMLQKSKSRKMHLLKYLLIIPILGMMLTYSACSDTTKEMETEQTLPPAPPTPPKPGADGTTEFTEIESLPFSMIDTAPVYPGCSGTPEELKTCFTEKLTQFVVDEFNTELANDLDLEGRIRIMSQFKVTKNGTIADINVRAPHPELEAETKRILNGLPTMEPAEHEGEKVVVMYSLPIVFDIQ